MLKLNAVKLLNDKGITKYKLFNELNTIRSKKGEKLMNYTNFLNIINQKLNKQVSANTIANVLSPKLSEESEKITKSA